MPIRTTIAALVACALLLPGGAAAQSYPPPSDPAKPDTRPTGKKARTLHVCKKRRRCFRTINSAIKAARRGDTVKVANGVYREAVRIETRRKDGLKLIGNPKDPDKVVIDVKGLEGTRTQNALLMEGARRVTVDGFAARNYRANGFFALNMRGYTFNHLEAEGRTGVYGLYAFNSRGGQMLNSQAYYHNDAGFYVGQTPPQTKPRRTIVRNVKGWGNEFGFIGTNMRYVTITGSEFFNNAIGVMPNALHFERFPPAEENVISDNDIFWNNFNFHAGAPFPPREFANEYDVPPGIGIAMLGSRTARVEDNRIFGNYLAGFVMVFDFAIAEENPGAADPRGNQVRNNVFGLGGADLNGRDLVYDGSGSRNCFGGNGLQSPNLPANGSTFATCPGPAQNSGDPSVLQEVMNWLNDETHEAYWNRHPHQPRKGYNPLEHWTPAYRVGGGL